MNSPISTVQIIVLLTNDVRNAERLVPELLPGLLDILKRLYDTEIREKGGVKI
jgi:hypothetical protein